MKFKQDAPVYTADGSEVGRLTRVVIEPWSHEVTHIVVRKGRLLTSDKVVPASLLASGDEDRVTLREGAQDLEALPDFEEVHYTVLNEEELARSPRGEIMATPVYWYPPIGAPIGALPAPVTPAYVSEWVENIPPETVPLKEGARVLAADGKHVGNVEQVLTDPLANRATHFLVSQGLLLKERKLVPMIWVRDVDEEEVRLAVGVRTLKELRAYPGE